MNEGLITNNMPNVHFAWNMLYDCNYRCPYCFLEGKWDEYKKRNLYLSPDEWVRYWQRIGDTYGPPYLVITGGEPFMYPDFIEIIKKLAPLSCHIAISTNGSGEIERFVQETDPQKVSLSFGFQPGYDTIENCIERLLLVQRHGFHGCVKLVAYLPFLKDLDYFRRKVASMGESLKIIPFFGEYQGRRYPEGYTQEQRQLIGISDSWSKKARKQGDICSAGWKTALVFPDGKVTRCGRVASDMVLGSLFDPYFELLDTPSPCDAEYCPCDEGTIIAEDRRDTFLVTAEQRRDNNEMQLELGSKSLNPQRRDIYFTWDIHYKCNFRCPYCWFYKGWIEASRLNVYLSPEEWMVHWERIYKKYGCVHIEITGGEPFIYPNFVEIVKSLSTIHTVKVTTNVSGDVESFAREIDPNRVNMDFNFHPLFIDLDTFIKKVLILKRAGFKGGVCYLAYPPQMGQMDLVRERIEKAGIGFALAAFWGEYRGKKYPESYTEEEREFMRPFLGDVSRLTYHLSGESPRGKLCNAGYRYAGIHANGDVVRCGPLVDKVLGNIMDEDFKLCDGPMPCEAGSCPCNEYINLIE